MNHFFVLLLVFLAAEVTKAAFPNVYKEIKQEEIVGDPGEPLILTSLIVQKKIKEAQAAAEVDSSLFLGVKSYAGYFTVNNAFDSNMFFWFFPSESDYENDPLILWLQGGPGATSLFGLFDEHGPFSVNSTMELEPREYSWTKTHSVLYFDNPVGTGYSFTSGGYAQNETQVGKELYNALIQFLKLFPELQDNDFYVSGESYAGKYVPALGYTILKKNQNAVLKVNLQGLAIGNGFSDPEHQVGYGEYLYQIGLVDAINRDKLKENDNEVVRLIQQGKFEEAAAALDRNQSPSIFHTATGFDNIYNYLYNVNPIDDASMGTFIQRSDIRKAIHVGSTPFNGGDVYNNLVGDVMQSVAPWISELLSNYRMLIYSGQVDLVIAYPLTVNYLHNLDFDSADEYKIAKRHIWYVGDDLAGYVKQAGNLTEALVRNAGHMVPSDQPKWGYDLISRFARNQPFY